MLIQGIEGTDVKKCIFDVENILWERHKLTKYNIY